MAKSDTELLIKINDATEYLRNAEGKNTVYLEGLSAENISTYKIIDDKLTITTSDNKTISLSNYRDITTLLTDEDGESEPVAIDITANKLVNNYDIITDPQDGNTISGTNFNDEINAINAGKIITTTRRVNRRNVTTTTYQGVVINAGDGNDTITGSIYDDTIDVAEGDNTINLTSGNDTINLGSGVNTFNIDITKSIGTNTITFAEGGILKFNLLTNLDTPTSIDNMVGRFSGSDLIIDFYKEAVGGDDFGNRNTEGKTLSGTVILKNYFTTNITLQGFDSDGAEIKGFFNETQYNVQDLIAKEYQNYLDNIQYQGGDTYYGTTGNDTINASEASQHSYQQAYRAGRRTLYRTVTTDTGVTIDSGAGDDTITGSQYNDTIIGGSGNNTVILKTGENFGNDIYQLTEGEALNIKLDGNATVEKAINGQDLVLTIKSGDDIRGTFTIQNFANIDKTLYGDLKLLNSDDTLNLDLKTITTNAHTYAQDSNYKYEGTRLDDTVDATQAGNYEYQQAYRAGRRTLYRTVSTDTGVTIDSGAGDDTITGSQYNDTIIGGSGNNTVILKTGENFGNDIYQLTEGEALNIKLDGNATVEKAINGQDLVLTVKSGDDIRGTFTIQNFGSINPSEFGDIKILKSDGTVFDLKTLTRENITLDTPSGSFGGTWLDETIDASNAAQYSYQQAYRSGRRTLYRTVTTDNGVTINSGAGNDEITGSAWNDNITGGKGENTIKFLSGENNGGSFGADTINLTEGENLILDLSTLGLTNNDIQYSISNNNLILTTPKGSITLVNYAKENVVGNDGSVQLQLTANSNENIILKDRNYTITTNGNYTSGWLNDVIDATNAERYTYQQAYRAGRRTLYKTIVTDTGVNIDSGAGNDKITGSAWNDTLKGGLGNDIIHGNSGDDTIDGGADNDTLYGDMGNDTISGGDGNDIIEGGAGNDKIFGGKGNNTIAFGNGDGIDTVYSDEGSDTLYFKDITDLNTLADKIILASDGTNLTIKYSDDDSVILDNYFTDSDHSVKTLQTAFGATISLKTFIDNYNRNGDGSNPRNFAVTGSGVINGTDKNNEILGNEGNNTINGLGGDDIIYGGKGDDTITGGTGTNKIVFAQNFGSDTVNLTQTENLTLDLSALRLNEDDITYSYDGDNLLITTSQGTISLVNFVSEDVTNDGQGNAGSVNLKLSEITTIDLRNKNYTIDAQRTKNGTWHNETIDASEVDRYTYQEPYRSGRRTLYRTVATDMGVSIDGGAGNDTLTGSAWNDTIVGGAGNDTIYGGNGNDTIYGDENPTTILPDGYINGSNIIYGGEGNDTIYGGNGDDEITGGEGDDIIRGGNGNNTIIYNTNNDGSDTIYSSGGTDILQFNNLSSINDLTFARWGTNLIIKYSEIGLITVDNYFLKNEEHDYDIDSGHSVKKVKIGNVETVIKTYLEDEEHPERLAITGQGLIEGSDTKNDYILGSNANDDLYGYGGNDTIDAGLGNNNIYLRSNSDEITSGHDKIKDGGGTDTIIFDNSVELEDLNFSFVGEIEGKKDLKISYGDNSVTIKDFQIGDYSVRYFKVGNTTYEINDFLTDKYGSNKNDNFMSTNADENFVLNKGNDTVTFGASFGQDTITSTQETDETGKVKNTDTLIFQDHSIATDNLDVSYNRNDVGVTDGIMIVARNTNEDQESGRVAYNGIISNDTPNLVIKDSANRTWDVNSYNNETSLDWSGDNKNRVAFIQGESGTNTIISNTGHNVINTSSGIGANGTSEDYGASLNYTYKGGHDRVKSESISDDTYNIDVFSSQTALSIKDAGGDDQYNIKTNAANIRFLFNVKNADYEGSYESFEDESWDQSSLFMIHRDKYNTQTIMDYIMGKEEKFYSEGIVTIKLASQAPDAVFSVTEDIRHMHTVDFTDDIDLTKWFEGIDSRVLSWISEHNFASTIHALDSITNACEHSQDEEGQPLVFEEWLNEHNFELTSNQTQHSLGNILINQLLDIYRNASYQAIVFNGGDGDDTIVGSINSDDITGGSGNNRIVFNGENFGVDTVNLTETENLTLDLTEYNFNKNDISFSYSGSDLVVTTPNGSIRLNNFASTNVVGENGNVKILLKDAVLNEETGAEILPAVLVDLKTENIVIQAERTTSGTWHNEIIDASEVDRYTYQEPYRSGKRTLYRTVTTDIGVTVNSEGGNDTVIGSAWNDTINGGEGDDYLYGEEGSDTIIGGSGNDTIYGGEGSDTIIGGSGNDTIDGGEGNDTIYGNSGSDTIHAGAGDDTIYADESSEISLETNYVHGSNIVYGEAGNDKIYSGKGNDTIDGGSGDDIIYANEGTNQITGGSGNDIIETQDADNTIYFNTDDGTDTIILGSGNNTLVFNDIEDLDELYDSLTLAYDGTNENFVIKYSDNGSIKLADYNYNNAPENDYILRAGEETITLADYISYYRNTLNKIINITGEGEINGTDGNDIIIGSNSNDLINANGGNDTIYGEAGDDIIHAETGRHTIYGGEGNDTIYGGDEYGNKLYGGAGDDNIYAGETYGNTINGGEGNDNIFVSTDGFDTVILDANCGNDIIYLGQNKYVYLKFTDLSNQSELESAISISSIGSDYIIKYGTNSITLKNAKGQSGHTVNLQSGDNEHQTVASYLSKYPIPNIIEGNNAANSLFGTDGKDIIYGYNGNDSLYGYSGEDEIYGGNGDDYISGGRGNDVINGGTGSNTMYFQTGDGDDVVENGGGVDTLYIIGTINNIRQEDNDLVIYYDEDSITVKDYYSANHSVKYIRDNTYTLYTIAQALTKWGSKNGSIDNMASHQIILGNQEQTLILADEINTAQAINATSSSQIFGGGDNDTITGSSENDYIFGGDGNDTIRGGGGSDRLWGGAGANTFVFKSGDGADIIYEYNADNTLYFPDLTSFNQLHIESSAKSLLANAHFGTSWTQQILTISGYGSEYDTVKLYNSGYENYKVKVGNQPAMSLHEFIRTYYPEISNFVTQSGYQDLGSEIGGGVQYVPTSMRTDLKTRPFISQSTEGTTIYSGGSAGVNASSITGGSGDDTMYSGLDENGKNILYFKADANAPVEVYEDYDEWGYARLCYKINRDAQGNPIVTSTNDDGSQDVSTTREVVVGGYFYTYQANVEYVGMEHSDTSEDWWDTITLSQSELQNYYSQYLLQKAAGTTVKNNLYEDMIEWDNNIEGTNRYYDSFTQYKSYFGSGTYEEKVNYYKPDDINEEFKTGALTETFTTTITDKNGNSREVTMTIYKHAVGVNFYGAAYNGYGYSITNSNQIDGGAGNDTLYSRGIASGGTGDDIIYNAGGSASGGNGNDKLVAFMDADTEDQSHIWSEYNGDAGDDLIDLSNTQKEYSTNVIQASEGVDTVLMNEENTSVKTRMYLNSLRASSNGKLIETRANDIVADAYGIRKKSGYVQMGDDLVVLMRENIAPSTTVIKDYYTLSDGVRNNFAITVPVAYFTYSAEARDFFYRYGNLGLQSSVGGNSNHQYLDFWFDVKAVDGDKMYINSANTWDYDGNQYAKNFIIRTETVGNNKVKYINRTRAIDSSSNEKGINVLSNGNILYKELKGYDEGNAVYETITILNDGEGNYYTESFNTTYQVPRQVVADELQYNDKTFHYEVKYDNNYTARTGSEYDSKMVTISYEYQSFYRNNNVISHGEAYNELITVYEDAQGRYIKKWQEGHYETDEQTGEKTYIDGQYVNTYLEKDGEGNYILPVKAGEYSYNDTQGYHNYDIISNIIITRTNLTKDGSGNLQFSSNVGNGSVVTGSETYTIYVDDKITLNQDGDGSLYFKKITGQDEAGNNIYQDVKVGKVDSNGVFTEIYGDNDLFNQAAYYTNNETTQSITALKDAYAKDDYIVGGAGSQKIYGGDGADVIYGANLPVYDDEGNLADIDTSADTIYGGDGSDYIIGGAGNDIIDGGEGADEIYAGEGDDIIVGGRGVRGSAGTYDNTYVNADVLKGEGGNDTIYSVGKYKNDGSLDMTINAQGEITDDSELRQYLGDYSRGLDENTEHIYSKNAISGGAGDDKIIANGWWDIVDGGDGDDTIDVYSKYDPMYYHEGDPLYANQNKHEIDGGAGDDTITLYGEAIGGTVSGGAGNDTIDASHLTLSSKSNIKWNYTPKGVTIDGGDGDNTIVGSIGDDSISVGYGNSTINAGAGDDSISMHGGGGSFAGYYSGKSIAHGGEGNDTIIGAGNDELYGDEGSDTLYFATGQTGTVIHPSHVTLNGGEGDDIYIEDDGIGYDTLIASAGNDVIKFTNVKSDSMSMYRQGNDLVIKHATAYGVVGGGVNNDNLLILKDYYSNSTTYTDSDGVTQTYRDSQGNPTTAKALFDNYRIELYDQDTRGMMRNAFTFSDFVKYATGAMRIIYSGSGTSANDYIEARNTVTDINAGAGDDTVIAGSGTKTISGGEGNDLIQGNQNAEVQFITGDNGKVTNVVINSEQYGSTFGQYSYTYTPGSSEGAGNDNITLYANNNFVWAEEGDDIIVDSADGVDHINRIWAGAGDDAIKANGMILDGGAGDDTIIGGGEVIDGGSGNDTIKASSINHSYYSGFYENKQQLLINKYSELGVNTQEALEIRDDLIELGENLREAITNRNSAASSLNVSSYGTDAYYLDYYIRSRDYQQDYVDQYTEALEKMDPDSESYSSNYSWNLNQLADYEIQRDSYQRSVDTYQAKVDEARENLEIYTNLINQYKVSIADKIEELRTKGYYEFVNNYGNAYSNNVVLGGSGDDEITIGYKEEKDGYLSGNFYVAGGADDDTYIIPDYYYEDENTGEIYHQLNMKAQICDVEGQNTLLLQSQDLTSGNMGVLINVTLKTDNEGNYVRDGQGNYEYTIENFKTYTQYSDTSWSPKGDGDMGFSIILTDSKNYQEAASDYYGGYGTAGIRLDEDTLEHLTRIQAYDGKYITIDQIYKVAQNTANWLGEHGYSDYQTAVGLDDVVDYTQSKINKEELLGYKALGSLEWLEDGNITTGATEGTEGTYLRDTLTSTSADEEFNLYSGSDIVTFEGAFGNDIINSTSEVDADGNAVQTDILNFKEYSIKDGNLTVELVGNDLRFTAYGGDGTLAGTATYKNVIGTAYNARTVIINDRDGEHKLLTEDAYSMKQDGYKFLSIYNNSSADTANHLVILNSSGEVTVQLNGSKNYNYTVADENTTLNYSGYGSGDIVPDKDIIVSKGETDDKYHIKFTAETDVTIDDMGGNDSLSILSGSNWYNQSDDVRLFFDVDYQGNVGESSNLIYKDCFTADNAKNIANLLDGVHTMKGVITFNGELESFETRDYSSSYLVTNGIIKLNEWKQAIAKNVSAWLQANGYRDVKQALATGNRALISAMIKLFDVTYSDAKAGNLEFSLYTDKSDNNVQTTLIKGTAVRDYINLPDNTGSRFVVKSGNGDDVIEGNADNSYIDTGEGNDLINITGNNNVINAGDSYNVINITGTGENSTNTLEVSGDNGATDLIKADNTNLTLKFDSKSLYLSFFKLGDRLGIKYRPSGSNHYLYLDNYFKEGNNVEYTAVCADKTITIKDLLQEWQSNDNVLQEGTTSYYDGVNIEIPSNTANDITVNSSYSSDKITGENLENVTINANVYGDEINISGTNNIIKPGEGRDYTYVRGAGENALNTVVYANDGCRDTLGGENTALTLQFKDSVYSDIKLSRVSDRLVIVYGNSYNVSYTYDNSGNTLKYAYSVSLENYFTQSNETKPRYTLEFKSDIGIDMEGKDGTKISLDDFITYYTAQYGDIVTVTNLTQIEGESYADIINIPQISGLTVDSKGGNDRIIGKDIENVTVLTGTGNDEVDISGYGNTITGGTGDDLIKVNTDTENGTNTLNFTTGDGNDIVLTNKATLYFTDTELESISLEKQGDNLIIRYSEDDSVTLEKYFNANVENAYTLKYKDGETTGTQSLDTYVSEYGDIQGLITYDVAGTDGDDTFLLTEKGSKVYLGEGNDTVYISNSAGGNTIISGTKTSSGYATNTDMLVFSDTTVTFSTSGDDLIISSEDFDSPIVYKDYLVFSEKHADLIVKDKENTYKIHTDKDKGDTQWYKYYENSSNPDYDSEYNHIGYYNDAPGTIQTNGKTSVINTLSGDGLLYGISSDYDTTEKGLVTFNAANPSSGNSYTIQKFTNESGILINDAGGNDSISFNKNTISSDKVRIFFDVIKENGVYHSDFHGMFVHSDTLFDYDKLLSALDEDWTPTHSGIIKFDAFDSQYDSISVGGANYNKSAVEAWVSKITTSVTDWLETENYNSVSEALADESLSDTKKAELTALYTQIDNHYYENTNGDDIHTFTAGVNNLTLSGNFGNDTINTDYEGYGGDYIRKDNISFDGYSFENGTLSAGYVKDGEGNLTKQIKFTAGDNSLTYGTNYNSSYNWTTSNTKAMTITDNDRTYETYIRVDSDSKAVDWSKDETNHLAFIKLTRSDNETEIISNDKYNIINAEGNNKLYYKYNGGHDIINSTSDDSNDTYRINSFNTTTSLTINDAGGKDTIIFSDTNTADIRLFFDMNADTEFVDDIKGFTFMHKDKAALLDGNWANLSSGVIKANGFDALSGTDKIAAKDNDSISLYNWVDSIREDVAGWLTEKGYTDTSKVFTSEKTDGDIEALIAIYNKDYSTIINQ